MEEVSNCIFKDDKIKNEKLRLFMTKNYRDPVTIVLKKLG